MRNYRRIEMKDQQRSKFIEMAREAGLGFFRTRDSDETSVDALERFAELIIKECANRASCAQDTNEEDIGAEDKWIHDDCPSWHCEELEYRIKPEEKKLVVRWLWAYEVVGGGYEITELLTEDEASNYPLVLIQLEWSRTEFPE